MATITKDEYVSQLREFINTEMAKLQRDGVRGDLKFWIKFNQDKEAEFKIKLKAEGTTVAS